MATKRTLKAQKKADGQVPTFVITTLEGALAEQSSKVRHRTPRNPDAPPRLPAPKTVERLLAEQREREQGRTLYRLRRHLYPLRAALPLLGLAVIAWTIAFATAADRDGWPTHYGSTPILGWLTLSVAAIAFGTTGGVFAATWSNLPHRWRAHWVAAAVAGSTWLTAVTWLGPSWFALFAFVVGTLAFSARWWRTVRIYGPASKPATEEGEHEVETIPIRWDRYVGSSDGALPQSWLTDREETERAESYKIHLHPGKHTFASAVASLDRIASGVGKPLKHLILEPHSSGLPNEVLFKVVHRSPIDENPRYDRPRYENGVIQIGPYGDGEGDAGRRLYTSGDTPKGGSMHSGVVIGGTGSGKSRYLEAIGNTAMATGNTVVWFLDPQGGSSSPALRDYADWYVDMSGAPAMLDAIKNIVYGRGLENASEDRIGFTPVRCTCVPCTCSVPVFSELAMHEPTCKTRTTKVKLHRADCRRRPGLLVIIDECHKVFTPDQAPEWAAIVRECRKIGVGLECASQYAGIKTFGGDEALRSSIMTGSAAAFFVVSKTSGKLMAGLEVDPYTLPRIPGLGYTMATTEDGRTAPFLNRLILEPGDWMANQPRTTLDDFAAKCAGSAYLNRHQSADDIRRASREQVDAIRTGRLTLSQVRRQAAKAARNGATDNGGNAPTSSPSGPMPAASIPTFPTCPPELKLLAGGAGEDPDEFAEEVEYDGEQEPAASMAEPIEPCPGCGVQPNNRHEDRCDVARCTVTGGQLFMCHVLADVNSELPADLASGQADPHDCLPDVWTGQWPEHRPIPAGAAGACAAVLTAMTSGATQKGEIQAATGYSESRVRQVLNELMANGLVAKEGHGRYKLADPDSGVGETG